MSIKKTTVMDGLLAVHCGTPMVGTIMFSGSEFYCVKCGATEGIFGTTDTESTLELQAELQENEKKFKEIAADCIAAGMWRKDCSQCNVGDKRDLSKGIGTEHRLHASHADLEKSDTAYKLLAGGILKEVTNDTN